MKIKKAEIGKDPNIRIPGTGDAVSWETEDKKVMYLFGHYSLIEKRGTFPKFSVKVGEVSTEKEAMGWIKQ